METARAKLKNCCMKKCTGPCGLEKPLSEFHNKGNGKAKSRCRVCVNEQRREHAKNNRKKYSEWNKKSRYNNIEHYRHKATELTDKYVISIIRNEGLDEEYITPDIIELKRQSILQKRNKRNETHNPER